MKPLQIYITEEQHQQLKQQALNKNTSMSDLVREYLGKEIAMKYLAQNRKEVLSTPQPLTKMRSMMGLCKEHGTPLTASGKCLQKGCKYA